MTGLLLAAALPGLGPPVWVETRETAFQNRENRTVAVPFYHMPVPQDVPFAWGFYYDYMRLPPEYRNWEYQRKCLRHMAEVGCNTFTPYGWCFSENPDSNGDDVVKQIEIGMEVGLVTDKPIMVIAGAPDDTIGWIREHGPEGMPEVIGYGPDEPGVEQKDYVRKVCEDWQAVDVRCGTAIDAKVAAEIGEPLDIWIIHMPNLGDVPDDFPEDKELWTYACQFRGTNYLLHRYYNGIYAFAAWKRKNVQAAWTWGYVHLHQSGVFLNEDGSWRFEAQRVHDHSLPTPDGPVGSVGLDGMRDGIQDWKILYEVNRRGIAPEWIEWVCDQAPLNFWDGTDYPEAIVRGDYFWDVPDIAEPHADVRKIIEKGIDYLRQPAPGP
jgi:hypothetical protein